MTSQAKKQPSVVEEEERFDFNLSSPINSFGEMVSVLKWRRPNGADLIKVGNPIVFYPYLEPVKVEHDFVKVVQMMARLTGTPTSSLEKLDPEDIASFAWTITPFFIPKMQKT